MRAYKFDLNPRIKSYVEWQLEHYHEDKKQLEEIKGCMMPPITTSISGMPHGSGVTTTEDAPMRNGDKRIHPSNRAQRESNRTHALQM